MTLIEVYLARQVVRVLVTGKCLQRGGAKSHGPNKERRHLILKGIMHELLSIARKTVVCVVRNVSHVKATDTTSWLFDIRHMLILHCKNASQMIHLKLL